MRSAIDRDALLVAMTVVPGLYSRNRMFALYNEPHVKDAKARAAILRGVVRHLVGTAGEAQIELARAESGSILRYRIERMRMERRIELSELEAACVAYLSGRGGCLALHATERDRALIEAALKRLALGLQLSDADGNAILSQ